MKEQDRLEAATGPVELVIGHNDLLAANILDDENRLWLIDWEYGGFNTPLFDLAGLAGNNGLSEAQERAMLERYFEAPAGYTLAPLPGDEMRFPHARDPLVDDLGNPLRDRFRLRRLHRRKPGQAQRRPRRLPKYVRPE